MGLFDFLKKKTPQKPNVQKSNTHSKKNVSVSITVHEPTPQELRAQRYDKVREIRVLQEKSFPSENGLRPHEILMLSYADKYATDQTEFPQFWYYQYAVSNPSGVLKSLQQKGFIRAATASESLSSLTILQLKSILSENGLKASGKKADLLAAVQTGVDSAILESAVKKRKYVLTALGQSELTDNAYIPYLHSHKSLNISIWDINKKVANYPNKLWRDIIWGELQHQAHEAMRYISSGNWGLFVNAQYQQVDFMAEEGKNEEAFQILVNAIHDQLTHVSAQYFLSEIELKNEGIKTGAVPSFSEIVSSDYCFEKLKKLLSILDYSGEQRAHALAEVYDKLKLSGNLFSKDDFISLLNAYLDEDFCKVLELCNKAQEKLLQPV